jgi:hypothetical protein
VTHLAGRNPALFFSLLSAFAHVVTITVIFVIIIAITNTIIVLFPSQFCL